MTKKKGETAARTERVRYAFRHRDSGEFRETRPAHSMLDEVKVEVPIVALEAPVAASSKRRQPIFDRAAFLAAKPRTTIIQ